MLQYLEYDYKQIKSYEISIIYIRYINWNRIDTIINILYMIWSIIVYKSQYYILYELLYVYD